MWPYTIVYSDYIWDYKNVWPVMDGIYSILKKAGIQQIAWIWIYHDNPEKVPVDQLRSQIGSVIDAEDISKIADLWLSYQTQIVAKSQNLVVSFPYKNKISYMIWAMKVYPFLNSYISSKWYTIEDPMIEIYDTTNKTIYYMVKK